MGEEGGRKGEGACQSVPQHMIKGLGARLKGLVIVARSADHIAVIEAKPPTQPEIGAFDEILRKDLDHLCARPAEQQIGESGTMHSDNPVGGVEGLHLLREIAMVGDERRVAMTVEHRANGCVVGHAAELGGAAIEEDPSGAGAISGRAAAGPQVKTTAPCHEILSSCLGCRP